MKTAPPPLLVERGEGVWLHLADGRRVMDCISSWWVTMHGHGHPALAEALHAQALVLEQVIFAGFTHEPAERLARAVLQRLPAPLTRVFYSDNGSTAVEAAMKMAFQFWQNRGQTERTGFLAFEGGYHGDTFGAMAAGASMSWWAPFKPLLCAVDLVPFPHTWEADADVEAREAQALAALEAKLDAAPRRYAALLLEPLVQGAGGMRLCRPEFLRSLVALAKSRGVLVIFDEVMTGFGRTGELFACAKAGATPDILCLSKGLSGGCLPLAVTVATEQVYEAFLSDDAGRMFFHGHSYTGNPLACATGLASLELMTDATPRFRAMEATHRRLAAEHLADLPAVERLRFCGTIMAFDVRSRGPGGYFDATGPVLKRRFLEEGFLIRPLGNTVYLLPPYCITDEQLADAYLILRKVVAEVG